MIPRTAIKSTSALRLAAFRNAGALRSSAVAKFQQRAASTSSEDQGEYPDVPHEYYQHRSQHLKYDDQQSRRNFGEPLQKDYDFVDVWSPDRFDAVEDSVAVRNNLIVIAGILGFSGLMYYIFPGRDFAPRSYPYDGLNKALGGTDEDKEIFQARVDSGN